MTQTFSYPVTRQDDVVDVHHGRRVADPYRWLEDPTNPEAIAWVEAQNALTQQYVQPLPVRSHFQQRLTELWNYARYTAPVTRNGRRFFSKNDGLQNQSVLYKQIGQAHPQVLLDPNQLSPDGTLALLSQSFTNDGRYMAYTLSQSGSDWQTIHVRDVDSLQDTGDLIEWAKFTSIAWLPDNSGFFYARYPAPGDIPDALPSTHQRVYFHRLGTPQTDDELVYARPDEPDLGFMPRLTADGRYLLLQVWNGTDPRNQLYYRDLQAEPTFVRLIDVVEARYEFLGNDGPVFYFDTDYQAANGRVIAIDVTQPDRANWRQIVAETEEAIHFSQMVNDQFVIARLHHASHRLYLFNKSGQLTREIDLPTTGTVIELKGRQHDADLYIHFFSFLYPPTIFQYDFEQQTMSVLHQATLAFDADQYQTTQHFYPSKDGTAVPIFLTYKKGLQLDGNNPTLLYGYGGFNINLTPIFSSSRLVWLEQGGIYAQAVLRGGAEYGEAWHQAGMLANKQNVFDDFIAAGEWLVSQRYTQPKKLAIEGRSNGGLLVAACLLQRPDLFGAVHCGVPVIDMLRYHLFTAGRYWISEYGNAMENADQFEFMMAYSPLHNVQAGVDYPPMIITTADTDDRVVPSHAKKFAATLQAVSPGNHPILLRVEQKAGHGMGKPTSKLIEEAADVYAFLWATLTDQRP